MDLRCWLFTVLQRLLRLDFVIVFWHTYVVLKRWHFQNSFKISPWHVLHMLPHRSRQPSLYSWKSHPCCFFSLEQWLSSASCELRASGWVCNPLDVPSAPSEGREGPTHGVKEGLCVRVRLCVVSLGMWECVGMVVKSWLGRERSRMLGRKNRR